MSWFTKAKTRISKYKYYTAFLYTHTFKDKKIPETNAGLAIENRLQLLKPLNIEAPKTIRPKIHLTELEKNKAINVVCDQIGSPTSSKSLANACWKIINMKEKSN